jgi:hypothetical protein
MTTGRAGFARASTEGTFKPLLPFDPQDELEAVAMYLDVAGERLLLVSLDFGQFSRKFSNEVRERMSAALHLPVEAIIFHATHNHSGPTNEDYVNHQVPLDNLIAGLVDVSGQAIGAAVPARMALAVADLGNQVSLCRRKWINDDVANLTNWYAYKNDMPRGSTANHLIRERLRRWFGPKFPEPDWLAEPIYYDNPVDPLVQLLAFEDERGQALGGLIRFAAHPHLMNAAEPNAYATDYCGAARRWLDRRRGGIHLFAEGPQCNLAPREMVEFVHHPGKLNWADTPYGPDGSLAATDTGELRRSVRQMGETLAMRALAALQPGDFRPLQQLEMKTAWHVLPMADDVPANSKTAWEIRDVWGQRIERARKERVSLIQMKRMTDQYNRFHWMQKMLDEWYIPSQAEIAERQLPVHLQAIRLNDTWIAGLPAETGLDTTLWLRANTVGQRLITVQQCNGDIGYIIPAQDRRGGDYEATCSLIADDGENVLRQGMLGLFRQLSGASPHASS